ncbi:MAG: sugar porter family MFS transporter [Pseudomonadota bacterium]
MTEASPQRANMGFIGAIVAVATIGGFLFGYDSGAVNGTQDGLSQAFGLVKGSWSPTNGLGFTVASLLIGCFIGAFFAGRLADLVGRRNTMIFAAILFLAGALVQGLAEAHIVFVIARICGGMAVGAASVLSPAYISEVAPAEIRGRLTTVQQIMIITGLTVAFIVNKLLQVAAGSSLDRFWLGFEAWRWMYLMQALPAVIFLVALFFIPESPRYLVSKGRQDKAEGVLASLFGSGVARAKLEEIRATFSADHRPRLSDIRSPAGGIRKVVWAGIMLAAFQQFVGINVIFYYGATLWQLAGFTEAQSLLINIGSGAVSIAACLGTIAVIDKIGRKPILLIGSAGMAVTLFTMVYAFSHGSLDPTDPSKLVLSKDLGILAVVAANFYVIFFNFSWGPVMWVMLGEMFPNQIRGSALAVSGFVQWFANFLISFSFPVMAAKLGLALSYSFYAVCAVISFFLVQKLVHETRGVELEQMSGH